jgi:hypothetical protein
MQSQSLRYVHKLALRSQRFEQQLINDPRSVLQRERVSEAEIRLIESFAPQNAVAFGMAVEEVEKMLYNLKSDISVLN